MMPLNGALLSSLQDSVKTLATCWKIIRTDGHAIRVTDHNARLTILDQHYTPVGVPSASAMQRMVGLKDRNEEVRGAITSDLIVDADLLSGKYRDAEVTEMLVNWNNPRAGPYYENKFWITSVSWNEEFWDAQLVGLSSRLTKPAGRIYNRLCDADLGDSRCKKDLTALTVIGNVDTVAIFREKFTSDNLLGFEDGYFEGGEVTWTSGNNEGIKSEVQTHLGSDKSIDLYIPLPEDIQVGDHFTIIPGCDKLFTTCDAKFDNTINFRGFPYIPGNDRLFFVPNAKS